MISNDVINRQLQGGINLGNYNLKIHGVSNEKIKGMAIKYNNVFRYFIFYSKAFQFFTKKKK